MAPLEVTAFGNEKVSWLGAHLELFRGQARPLGHRRGVPRGGAPLDLRVASLRLTRQLRESLIQRRGGVRQALGGAAPVGDHHDAAAARGHAARLVLAFAGHARGDAGRITLLAARCVTSRGTRQTKKKIGANKIEATSKKVFQSVIQEIETCRERWLDPRFLGLRETRADRSNDLPADLAISRPKASQLLKIDSLGFGRGACARCASRH